MKSGLTRWKQLCGIWCDTYKLSELFPTFGLRSSVSPGGSSCVCNSFPTECLYTETGQSWRSAVGVKDGPAGDWWLDLPMRHGSQTEWTAGLLHWGLSAPMWHTTSSKPGAAEMMWRPGSRAAWSWMTPVTHTCTQTLSSTSWGLRQRTQRRFLLILSRTNVESLLKRQQIWCKQISLLREIEGCPDRNCFEVLTKLSAIHYGPWFMCHPRPQRSVSSENLGQEKNKCVQIVCVSVAAVGSKPTINPEILNRETVITIQHQTETLNSFNWIISFFLQIFFSFQKFKAL